MHQFQNRRNRLKDTPDDIPVDTIAEDARYASLPTDLAASLARILECYVVPDESSTYDAQVSKPSDRHFTTD